VKELGIQPSSSKWIMTHGQINGKESPCVLKHLMKNGFEEWHLIQEKNKIKIPFYDLGDGKNVYMMTGHSQWNSTHHPFVSCKCKRGEGVKEGFFCKKWLDEEYVEHVKKSGDRWDIKENISNARGSEYNKSAHMSWNDERNYGVSNFGSLPEKYQLSNLRLDVFHIRGNVVKIFLSYIQKLFDNNYHNIEPFACFLFMLKGWTDYEVSPWIIGDSLSRLKGIHTKEFVKNIPNVIALLQSLCQPHEVEHFNKSLETFMLVSVILSLVLIDDFDAVKKFNIHLDQKIQEHWSRDQIAKAIILLYKK
jgi:hypothetical protein